MVRRTHFTTRGSVMLDVGISCSSSRAILLRDGAVSIWPTNNARGAFVVGHSTPRQHRPPHSHLAPHRPLVNNVDCQYSVFLILIPLTARRGLCSLSLSPASYPSSPFYRSLSKYDSKADLASLATRNRKARVSAANIGPPTSDITCYIQVCQAKYLIYHLACCSAE